MPTNVPRRIAVSIMFIEIFTIFLPCWQAYKHQTLRQETLDMIAAWESRYRPHDLSSAPARTGSSSHGWTMISEPDKPWKTASTVCSDGSLLSMGALERLLEHNPEPLRQFSALKDFSGENVAFLAAVTQWKKSYPAGQGKQEDVQGAYTRALEIYAKFVSPRHAEFPINISFQEMASMEATFESAARILYGESSVAPNGPASAFVPHDWPRSHGTSVSQDDSEMVNIHRSESLQELHTAVRRISYYGEIPECFSVTTFDQVESSIKYLVLTNTWPKFLQDSRRSWNLSSTAQESVTDGQGTSLGLRLVRLLSCEI